MPVELPEQNDEASYKVSAEKIPLVFERLERALEKQGAGPFFNGAKYRPTTGTLDTASGV